MHTTRRFFAGLLTIVIGIAVPMTLEPSGPVLAVMWSLIAMALLGMLVTWEPVARRLPYRIVRTVNPHELPAETAEADARLADDCEQLAHDIGVWLLDIRYDPDKRGIRNMPPEFSEQFDGRLFHVLERLVARKYITREDLRRLGTENTYLVRAEQRARVLQEWANRLRRR